METPGSPEPFPSYNHDEHPPEVKKALTVLLAASGASANLTTAELAMRSIWHADTFGVSGVRHELPEDAPDELRETFGDNAFSQGKFWQVIRRAARADGRFAPQLRQLRQHFGALYGQMLSDTYQETMPSVLDAEQLDRLMVELPFAFEAFTPRHVIEFEPGVRIVNAFQDQLQTEQRGIATQYCSVSLGPFMPRAQERFALTSLTHRGLAESWPLWQMQQRQIATETNIKDFGRTAQWLSEDPRVNDNFDLIICGSCSADIIPLELRAAALSVATQHLAPEGQVALSARAAPELGRLLKDCKGLDHLTTFCRGGRIHTRWRKR